MAVTGSVYSREIVSKQSKVESGFYGDSAKPNSSPTHSGTPLKFIFMNFCTRNSEIWKKAQIIHALSKIFGPNYSKITELKQSDTYFTSSTCVSEITHNSPLLICIPEIQKVEKIIKNSCFEWNFWAKTSKFKAQQF